LVEERLVEIRFHGISLIFGKKSTVQVELFLKKF